MALSAELREALARRANPARKTLRSLPSSLAATRSCPESVPSSDASEANKRVSSQESLGNVKLPVILALPPIPPAWGFLTDRVHDPVSIALAQRALVSLGCYLGIRPSPNALLEAARCRSAGALRNRIAALYGAVGLSTTFQLAGIPQPLERQSLPFRTASQSAAPAEDLVRFDRFSSEARIKRWFNREEPVAPSWRTRLPPSEQDDGAWVGI
jgi:hypothetical protein